MARFDRFGCSQQPKCWHILWPLWPFLLFWSDCLLECVLHMLPDTSPGGVFIEKIASIQVDVQNHKNHSSHFLFPAIWKSERVERLQHASTDAGWVLAPSAAPCKVFKVCNPLVRKDVPQRDLDSSPAMCQKFQDGWKIVKYSHVEISQVPNGGNNGSHFESRLRI